VVAFNNRVRRSRPVQARFGRGCGACICFATERGWDDLGTSAWMRPPPPARWRIALHGRARHARGWCGLLVAPAELWSPCAGAGRQAGRLSGHCRGFVLPEQGLARLACGSGLLWGSRDCPLTEGGGVTVSRTDAMDPARFGWEPEVANLERRPVRGSSATRCT